MSGIDETMATISSRSNVTVVDGEIVFLVSLGRGQIIETIIYPNGLNATARNESSKQDS